MMVAIRSEHEVLKRGSRLLSPVNSPVLPSGRAAMQIPTRHAAFASLRGQIAVG